MPRPALAQCEALSAVLPRAPMDDFMRDVAALREELARYRLRPAADTARGPSVPARICATRAGVPRVARRGPTRRSR
jgi:hypothetical protein